MSNLFYRFYRFEPGHHQRKPANKWNTWNIETAWVPESPNWETAVIKAAWFRRNQSVNNSRNSVRKGFWGPLRWHTDAGTSVHCKSDVNSSTWVWHCFCTMRLAVFNSALWIVQLELKLVHVHLVWWSYDVSFAIIRPHMQISLVFVSLCD